MSTSRHWPVIIYGNARGEVELRQDRRRIDDFAEWPLRTFRHWRWTEGKHGQNREALIVRQVSFTAELDHASRDNSNRMRKNRI